MRYCIACRAAVTQLAHKHYIPQEASDDDLGKQACAEEHLNFTGKDTKGGACKQQEL